MTNGKRLPSSVDALSYLNNCNIPVDLVVDVGVLTCTYSLIKCYPSIKHILIEPVRQFHDNIQKIYNDKDINFKIINAAAGAKAGKMFLCEYSNIVNKEITHSQLVERKELANKTNLISMSEVNVITIDSLINQLIENYEFDKQKKFLLKIDVDGIEEQILEGFDQVAQLCSIIVIEVPIAKIPYRLNVLEQYNFQCVDIVDLCYYKGALSQVDMIYVNRTLLDLHGVDPWKKSNKIQLEEWYEGHYIAV